MIKRTLTTDHNGNQMEVWEQTDEEKKRIDDAWAETYKTWQTLFPGGVYVRDPGKTWDAEDNKKTKDMSELFEKSWIEEMKKKFEKCDEEQLRKIKEYSDKLMLRNPDIVMKNFGKIEKLENQNDMDNLETKIKKYKTQLKQEDFEEKLKKSKKTPIEKISDVITEPVRELNLNILEDITEIKSENKDWVLKSLGFKRINTYTWEHPWFTNNKEKYIEFDIDTDDLPKLVTKIFNKGMSLMSEKIINVIK